MDADLDLQKTWKELESALAQAGVPRALWPVYFEKEGHRADRRRAQNDDEKRIIMRRISDRDIFERRRRERFAVFVMMLYWLLLLEESQAAPFLDFSFRALLTTEYARIDTEAAQVALCGVAWAKFGRGASLERALQVGVGNMDGSAAFPMRHAIRALESIDLEAEAKKEKEKEPEPVVVAEDVASQEQDPQPEEQPEQPFDPDLAAPVF